MTKEEAIEILSRPRSMKNVPDDIMEAHEMAIKALEQQTCEDAISRQAAIDALKQAYWNKDMQNAKDDPCIVDAMTDWAIRTIKDLPSVNPQRTGHWIQTQEKDDAEPFILWECSECHKEFRSVVHKVSNYCPSCGCRIVEP